MQKFFLFDPVAESFFYKFYFPADVVVRLQDFFAPLDGVNDRAVVAVEGDADGGQRVLRVVFAQVHADLARDGDFAAAGERAQLVF